MPYDPRTELVDVIDPKGKVIGTATRQEIRQYKLAHRSVYILVFNGRKELFIHQRTMTKDIFPGYWDVCIGGVVAAGESFDDSARREGTEELGVAIEPQPLFPFHYIDENSEVHGMVYRATQNGPFSLQEEEIVQGEFVSLAEAKKRITQNPFCPDGLAVLAKYESWLEQNRNA
jgi:isopentenyldiphosphate isomerase